MINPLLHRQPVAVDRDKHRQLRLTLPVTDWSVAGQLNALFLAAVEFGDACHEYPIVFVKAGTEADGKPQFAPLAVFGLVQGQNLFVDGGRWLGRYQPALLRSYPFCVGRISDERFAICLDAGWAGLSQTEGQLLFTAAGEPSALMATAKAQMEALEGEVQRTRAICQRIRELDVLREMRFDATLPDGRKHTVDGFTVVDEAKVKALPDATLAQLHRDGILGLIERHWLSLAQMARLFERFVERRT